MKAPSVMNPNLSVHALYTIMLIKNLTNKDLLTIHIHPCNHQ